MTTRTDFDAVVIGAGFSGRSACTRLRNELGLSVRVLRRIPRPSGGTWYCNRTPRAPAPDRLRELRGVYCYSFSTELLPEWDWERRYPYNSKYLAAYIDHSPIVRVEADIPVHQQPRPRGTVGPRTDHCWQLKPNRGRDRDGQIPPDSLGLLAAKKHVSPDLPDWSRSKG